MACAPMPSAAGEGVGISPTDNFARGTFATIEMPESQSGITRTRLPSCNTLPQHRHRTAAKIPSGMPPESGSACDSLMHCDALMHGYLQSAQAPECRQGPFRHLSERRICPLTKFSPFCKHNVRTQNAASKTALTDNLQSHSLHCVWPRQKTKARGKSSATFTEL